MKHFSKVNVIRTPLKVNTSSGAMLGPRGIAPLEVNIHDQNFAHNFVVFNKLKHLILGLDVTQRCRIGIDWDMYGKLFLRGKAKKMVISMKTNDLKQGTIGFLKTPPGKEHKTDQKLCLITNNTVTIPSYHISIAPLKAINYAISNNIKLYTLVEIEETPFLVIEQPDPVLTPMLQNLGPRIVNVYMVGAVESSGQTTILKRSMTISNVKESDYIA